MADLKTETPEQLTQLNTHLAAHNYVNGDLPGADDVRIFDALKTLPNRDTHNEVHFWYLIIQAFAPQIRAQWAGGQAQKEEKKSLHQQKAAEEKKPAVAEVEKKVEEEVDLFGSDEDEATTAENKRLAEEKKAQALADAPPKKKKAVIAKTIIIFDVKVYEAEDAELLERIAQKVKTEIVMDGLLWVQEHKIELVAYGAKKLKLTMIVEDDKVTTDDVFDRILAWEDDVQSVDVVTMQKV